MANLKKTNVELQRTFNDIPWQDWNANVRNTAGSNANITKVFTRYFHFGNSVAIIMDFTLSADFNDGDLIFDPPFTPRANQVANDVGTAIVAVGREFSLGRALFARWLSGENTCGIHTYSGSHYLNVRCRLSGVYQP